jgi:hypothetical protein
MHNINAMVFKTPDQVQHVFIVSLLAGGISFAHFDYSSFADGYGWNYLDHGSKLRLHGEHFEKSMHPDENNL